MLDFEFDPNGRDGGDGGLVFDVVFPNASFAHIAVPYKDNCVEERAYF